MVLEKINKPNDIKSLTDEELKILASEIREFLIEKISVTGGHLASNLGVVELTMALHLALDLPKDKIIWDVGHQSYTHKLLTGRREGFDGLRKYGGMSGFPKRKESACDCFDTGHSSTSISAGLGYALAREITGEDYRVVSVIGDGALTGGMAFEALNNAARLKSNFIIILNKNLRQGKGLWVPPGGHFLPYIDNPGTKLKNKIYEEIGVDCEVMCEEGQKPSEVHDTITNEVEWLVPPAFLLKEFLPDQCKQHHSHHFDLIYLCTTDGKVKNKTCKYKSSALVRIPLKECLDSFEATERALNKKIREKANELGVDVIVTDHHNYDDELPDAFSIIHTKISPDYPYKEISGGFVAYKLASALLKKHDKYLFSLAAITTISDMMPLLDENRALVKRALEFMKENKFPQLELLLGNNQKYNVTSIGFIIAPKINSFGRLPELVNPNHLVKYFLKDVDQKFAIQISQYAKKINSKRQSLTNEQYKNILENSPKDEFLYSYNQEVHEGIVGLIAGKYTHEFQKPSFVMKYDEKNEVYRGSARSVESIPLNQIFDDLKEYFVQYGGHALAGGFQVAKDEVLTLKEALHTYLISHTFSDEKHLEGIEIDLNELTLPAVRELELLEPYGQCNEEMKFILKDITNFTSRVLSDGKHLRFDIPLNKGNLQALYFNCSKEIEQLQQKKTISLIGTLKINKYLNTESINMIIEDMK